MRIALLSLNKITVSIAKLVIEDENEVVIIEKDKELIDEYSDKLDCSFLNGDGSSPEILKEINPTDTDVLLCFSSDDHKNIISALVARSLGVKRVVLSIEDPDLEKICNELDLKDVLIPSQAIGRYVKDLVSLKKSSRNLGKVFKGDARVFRFTINEKEEGTIKNLNLPKDVKVICYYRKDRFFLADESTSLEAGDEAIILTDKQHFNQLPKKWVLASEQNFDESQR
ncbi:MAG: TrkA family potassium uptake protein [Chlamydiales bacterium]